MKRNKQKLGHKAVIYLRISTDEQKKGFGMDSQLSMCSEYCQRKGYDIVGIERDEGISGTKTVVQRHGLRRAITLAELGADVIVAYHQDRFSRSTGVFDDLRENARSNGYRLETSDGRELTAEEDELNGDAMAFVATVERKLICKRLKNGRKERSKRDGRGSGPLPYGYEVKDNTITVVPSEAETIKLILKSRDAGIGYRKIVELLNGSLIPSKRGGPWCVGSVQTVIEHKTLYETGKRVWGTVESAELWPMIVTKETDNELSIV